MENLITIQVTEAQRSALQCLAAESAEDANLLEQALAVPIPAAPMFVPIPVPPSVDCNVDGCSNERLAGCPYCTYHWNDGIPTKDLRGQTDTEEKYCAHCDGGISQPIDRLLTCPNCGGFYHEYRQGCAPDKFHAEPQACDHPDGQNGDTWATCHDCGKARWLRIPERESCPKCGGILDSDGVCQNARAADEECPHGWTWDTSCRQCGRLPEVASCSHGVRNGCRECRGDYVPDAEPDPAVAQLQRAVKQAGERLAALEALVDTFATDTEVDKNHDEFYAHLNRSGDRRIEYEKRFAAVEHRTVVLTNRIAALEDDKRNAPWLEVFGSQPAIPGLYSPSTIAEAFGLTEEFVRAKVARYFGNDEPVEVAEPVDSDYRHEDGEPIYDLDT